MSFTPYSSGSADLMLWLDTKNTSSYQPSFGSTLWYDLASGSYATMSVAVKMTDTGSGFDFTANEGQGNDTGTNLSGAFAFGNFPRPVYVAPGGSNVWYDGSDTRPFAWEAIFTIYTGSGGLQASSITSLFGNRRNSSFVWGFRSQSAAVIAPEGIYPQYREDDTSITSSLSLTPGVQYHLIIAQTGSGPGVARDMRFYLEYSGSGGAATGSPDPSNPTRIGDLNTTPADTYWKIACEQVNGYNFSGHIRMMRLWNRELSESEITDLFSFENVSGLRTGSSGPPPTSSEGYATASNPVYDAKGRLVEEPLEYATVVENVQQDYSDNIAKLVNDGYEIADISFDGTNYIATLIKSGKKNIYYD